MKKISLLLLFILPVLFSFNSSPPGAFYILNKSHPLSQGLVACFLLNEQGGKTAHDIASVNGLISQPVLESGANFTVVQRGGALLCVQNSSSRLVVGAAIPKSVFAFDSVSAFSISMWIYPTSSTGGDLFGFADVCCTSAGYYADWGAVAANRINFDYYDASNFTRVTTSVGGVPTNTWTHVVFTRDGANSTTSNSAYLNGVSNGTKSNSGTPHSLQGTLNFVIGGRGVSGSPTGFPGYIQLFQVWNRCLSATEAMQLYTDPYCMLIKTKKPIF